MYGSSSYVGVCFCILTIRDGIAVPCNSIKMKEEIKKEFINQFSIILTRKRRPIEEIFKTTEYLYSLDPKETVKLAFITLAYAREGAVYKPRSGKIRMNVMGLRNLYEGIGMVYWLMKNQPRAFYSNLYQIGALFGGWKEFITIWELDLKLNECDLSKCCISQCKMHDILMKAILDKDYGPEATRALPNIRRSKQSNTNHRKCRNIIGKYLRSRMPKNPLTNQNKYYKLIKRSYRGVKVYYKKYDMEWIKNKSVVDAYDIVMNQQALKFINFKYYKQWEESSR